MAEQVPPPAPLRIISAAILGCIVGVILFLIVALGIGAANDRMHMNIPINLLVAENIFSAILLLVLVVICVAGFIRMVQTTPPSEPEPEE
ncbi:MAG TPA: hypothetical protein VHN82_02905 [Methanoregula sp.]|nr:hypothetical protein [Methanoregula sp.]